MRISGLPRRRLVVIATACVIVAGAAVFALARRDSHDGTAADGKPAYVEALGLASLTAGKGAARRDVRKQAVEAVAQPVTLRLTGNLMADEKSEVGSNAAGIVSQTCVDRGSVVKKGDLLVQLDPRDAQYALDEGKIAEEELRVRLALEGSKEFRVEDVPEVQSARLAVELAEKNFHRAERLKASQAVSQSELDQTETEYRSALQRRNLATYLARQLYQSYRRAATRNVILQKALDDCSILAPFDGWVAERNISVGERVIALFPGARLVTLLRIDPLRLLLTVPQQELAQVKVGQTVTFETDAFAGKKFTGTVRRITPMVDSDNRSLCIEALVANPDSVLRPGLFVTAELHLDKSQPAIFVPHAAVQERGDVAAVFVLRKGVFREQIVSAGEAAGSRLRVLAGLKAGDVVATTPELVRDGDPE
jgi:RND family efflux transporter MFP subunit